MNARHTSRTGLLFVILLLASLLIWLVRRWYFPMRTREVEREAPLHSDGRLSRLELQDNPDAERPLQLAQEGVGAMFHRRYVVNIENSKLTPEELTTAIQSDLNYFVPEELARFEKTSGIEGQPQEGDEYHIHISGPWDGPVRTIRITPTSFAFATLKDHLEAGEIHFRIKSPDNERVEAKRSSKARREQRNTLQFEIASWARSRDSVVRLAYERLGVAKAAQTSMWVFFCDKVVEASGGERVGKIEVYTERIAAGDAAAATGDEGEDADRDSGAGASNFLAERLKVVDSAETAAVPQGLKGVSDMSKRRTHDYGEYDDPLLKRFGTLLDSYYDATSNYDRERREEYTEANGWRIDDYEIDLPPEPPGQPLPNGSWALGCDVLRNYEFPDPDILTGIYVPDEDLDQRVMLLRARFLFFHFNLGVRTSEVTDQVREVEGREVQEWGYGYYTLEGHFEMGEITFLMRKWLDDGTVQFHIHAHSKTGHIANPFYRIGFWLFGRRLQVRFSRRALERMQDLVEQRLQEQAQLM